MQLIVRRKCLSKLSTIGELFINGQFECHTLENPVRDTKIYGHTAIPTGTYKVALSWSPRFKKKFPLLLNVPNFEGVRIHVGNFPANTEGCILVGKEKGPDRLYRSREAFKDLLTKLSLADLNHEDILITIS